MLAAIRSAAVLGIDAYNVTVEVDVALGLPQLIIVGLQTVRAAAEVDLDGRKVYYPITT